MDLTTHVTLPVEVLERVIDYVASDDHPGFPTLCNCALLCRALYNRSRYLLLSTVRLRSVQHTFSLARLLRGHGRLQDAIRAVAIEGCVELSTADMSLAVPSLRHLSTFTVALAGILPCVDVLELRDADWAKGTVHPNAFMHLSSFPSISVLSLSRVQFSDASTFGKLISALPCLDHLQCSHVVFLLVYRVQEPVIATLKSPLRMRSIQMDAESAAEMSSIFRNPKFAGQLERIHLGTSLSPLPLKSQDLRHTGYQQLLNAAGPTLLDLDLIVGDWDCDPYTAVEKIAQHFSLAQVKRLGSLNVTINVGARDYDIPPWADVPEYMWIATWLGSLPSFSDSPGKIHITFSCSLHVRPEICERLIRNLRLGGDPKAIDNVLARDPFLHLQEFTIEVRDHCNSSVPEDLELSIRKQMAQTDRRGILRVVV
ncbi:uncharacterized protein C8Q71DRAFT_317872 [Rhodofomes roseus]|uniref:F-box domain-containing protein n=1 Tax=Rhodofomes roseus TaxID=34475 RepID=A0ABQ8K2Q4_9APHY|nr:uncharacterized protein C8Q71DRAFT_317872 [Rhodofomes roseus]KAH9831010.1 hypothetical protein C8Q71DRAFT_317872 [Rhodofomes roseus]